MRLHGLVGTEQRLRVAVLEPSIASEWKGQDSLANAIDALERDELEDGIVAVQGGTVLVVDVVASICGVFTSDDNALALVGVFPKKDTAHALANGFAVDGSTGASIGASKLGTFVISGSSLVIWNAAEAFRTDRLLSPASDSGGSACTGLEIKWQSGTYEVWGEAYEHRGAWGLAEVRIRIVPEGRGIRIGARI